MRKTRRLLILLPIALFLLVIVVAVKTLGRSPALREWRLPDGSRVTVEGFTYGPEHRFLHGTGWQGLLLTFLPAKSKRDFMRRYRCRDIHVPSRPGGDSLAVWTLLHQASRTSGWPLRITAVDEHGLASEAAGTTHAEYLNYPPTERFEGWQLASFPRRGKNLHLRVTAHPWQTRSDTSLGELVLPNPSLGPHPSWTPELFPIRCRSGDLECTLTGLTTGLTQRDVVTDAGSALTTHYGQPVARSRETAWTCATFRIRRNGRTQPEWQPIDIRGADATGNTFANPSRAPTHAGDEARLYFASTLWPDEPAWKLKVTFARTTGFAPVELWTVRDIPVPEPGGEAYPVATAQRKGVTVSLGRISGPWPLMRPSTPDWLRFRAVVEVNLSPKAEDLHVTFVRATDEQGRELSPRLNDEYRGRYSFGLHGPSPAKKLNLTFAIHRSRSVEFLAKASLSPPTRP
jgi:hypothetical protein